MNVGIVCYASVGGSGIIATELGKALASRGHRVHILSSDMPVRLGDYQPGLSFHRVETPSYPLFREPQYLLSLANKIVQVSRDEQLDIVHAHYAIPHATAAYLARQILAATGQARSPRVITTLHGTDITLLGSDRVVFGDRGVLHPGVRRRHGRVGEPEERHDPRARRHARHPRHSQLPRLRGVSPARGRRAARAAGARTARSSLIHVSNFRPVKRVKEVVEIFARVRRAGAGPAADGRRRPRSRRRVALARSLGVRDDVQFLGEQDQVVPLLSAADVFLLPSSQESFGLAALEAMACEVPVVASRIGGLPEVVEDGVTGFLHDPDDLEGMAHSACGS